MAELGAVELAASLAAGFIFVARWRVTRELALGDGHRLYFAAVVAAFPITWFAVAVTTPWAPWLLPGGSPEVVAAGTDLLVFARMPLAWTLAWLLNLPFARNQGLLSRMVRRIGPGDPMRRLLMDASEAELPVLITLGTGKVYLGYVLSGEPFDHGGGQWLRLAPWMSGYRDDAHALQFTTTYAPVASKGRVDEHDGRFQVAVPIPAISTIQPFDIQLYLAHFKAADPSAPMPEWPALATPSQRDRGSRDLWLYASACATWAAWLTVPGLPLVVEVMLLVAGIGVFAILCHPASEDR